MEKSNKSLLKAVLAVFGAVAAFFAANIAAVLVIFGKNVKKLEARGEESSEMMSYILQLMAKIDVKRETQNAIFTAFFSNISITVPKPEKEHLYIEVISFASKVKIDLPYGVKINCKGSDKLEFEGGTEESDTTIDLVVNDRLSAIEISFH